jgi:hypothetical protein
MSWRWYLLVGLVSVGTIAVVWRVPQVRTLVTGQ